jgi:hypothetical protein
MATSELVGRDRLDDDAGGQPAPAPGEAGPRWWGWVALGLVVLPLAVSALYLRLWHDGYRAAGDLALTELQTRDVGLDWIELGPYSRDGWSHPGPALFYALAPLYRLLGSVDVNLAVAALAINAAAIAGMALVARRRGGLPLMLATLVASALVLRSLGPDHIRLAWNPWVTVLSYGLLVFLVWALACGDRWALPVAVAVGSAVAQTHVGYVALALPLVALGAAWLVVATPRAQWRRLAAPALVAVAAAAVLWFPPVFEQVANDPGNMRYSATWFRDGGLGEDEPNPLSAGWNTVVTSQWSVPPEWAVGTRALPFTGEPASRDHPRLPVLLPVVAASAFYLVRRRVPGATQLVAVWLAATAVAVVATARTVGPIYAYRLDYTFVVGIVGGIIVLWAAWTALAAWRPAPARRALAPGVLAAVAALAVVSSVAHVRAGEPQSGDADVVRSLVPDVIDNLPPGDGEVVVDARTFGGAAYRSGVVLGLEQAGIDAVLPAGDLGAGRQNAAGGDGPVRARLRVETDVEIARFVEGGWELLAYTGSLPVDELIARTPATRELEAAKERGEAWAFADTEEIRRTTVPPGSAAGVFLVPAPDG